MFDEIPNDKLERTAWVYLTTNLINGKKYIGQTVTPISGRKYVGSGILIKRAIEKYGIENFVREDLFEGTESVVDIKEAWYIKEFNAVESDEFYNVKEGGHHGRHSKETRSLMSQLKTGRKASIESIQKRSKRMSGEKNPFFGKTHSDESINKIKSARAKQVITADSNQKRSIAQIGKKKQVPVSCPRCGQIGGKGNMLRYHFDNCKKKEKV